MHRFRFLILALVGLFVALSALAALAQPDPNPRFIPLCSKADLYPDATDCIPDESVAKYQATRLWNFASRQLPKCSIVVLNPDEPFVAENLGYRCNGVITGAGIVPDENDAP